MPNFRDPVVDGQGAFTTGGWIRTAAIAVVVLLTCALGIVCLAVLKRD